MKEHPFRQGTETAAGSRTGTEFPVLPSSAARLGDWAQPLTFSGPVSLSVKGD